MSKKMFAILTVLGLAMTSLAGCQSKDKAVAPEKLAAVQISISIDDFFLKAFEDHLMESPESLSSSRYLESKGETWVHDKLDDASDAHRDKMMALTKVQHAALLKYDDAALSENQQLSKKLMLWSMETDFLLDKYKDNDYLIAQNGGIAIDGPLFFNNYHQVTNEGEAAAYLKRLHEFSRKMDQTLERVSKQAENGIILPKFLVTKVLGICEDFISQPPTENILYTSYVTKREKAGLPGEGEASPAAIEAAVRLQVYPAYERLIVLFKELEAKASDDAGAWKLPDGAAFYQAKIREQTTTDMTAEEIHTIGLKEVDRIQGEILKLFKKEGYDTSKGFTPLIKALGEEKRFFYSDDDQGRAEILADYRKMIEEVNQVIASSFNVKPKSPVEVRRVPKFSEQSAPGAYYTEPALDGSRPGIFWANLYDIKATPKNGMRTLTYHEAVPGHHFQIAITQEVEDMPLFRKYSFYNAYVEGWALYAEKLAKEMGLQENSFDDIGRLQAELFRAVRLVVDTGMHHKRWSREQAIEYMSRNTGYAMSDVVSEIERYIVWPAQALGYKIGMLKILEIRDKARSSLGDKFDIAAFHDIVLTKGAMPLSILEEEVAAYIATASQ